MNAHPLDNWDVSYLRRSLPQEQSASSTQVLDDFLERITTDRQFGLLQYFQPGPDGNGKPGRIPYTRRRYGGGYRELPPTPSSSWQAAGSL